MKTLQDLFTIQGIATKESMEGRALRTSETASYSGNTWFFTFSGHVNSMSCDYYPLGWKKQEDDRGKPTAANSKAIVYSMDVYLTDAGIQLMYWFIYKHLTPSGQGDAIVGPTS